MVSQARYDVFLSFRGEDTRDNFISHLYAALKAKQILTFIDNNELGRGEVISPTLLKAIQESKISVIVLSPSYASSKWCLEELMKIMDCKENIGQVVIPVFYRVDPSHVRNLTGSFANAFANHEEVVLLKEKVDKWKGALMKAANLSGWDSMVTRPESKLIKEIVEDILKKLNRMSQSHSKTLVGIGSQIKAVESLLCMESQEVRSVGIWGMGGIGKTTIAEAVFSKNCCEFEGFLFLPIVKEELRSNGIVPLWNRLVSKLLGEEILDMGTLSLGLTFIKDRLRRKKVLIVLDNVDDSFLEQLKELLVGQHNLFGPGSKILITSRDRQVLKNLVDEIYKVEELKHTEAFQLLCMNAFKEKYLTADEICMANKVVNYAKGNPLAIKVLGSTLFGRSIEDWDSALNKLEKVSKPRILNVLKISYDELSCEEKSIFLDIACFFIGENIDYATKRLDTCYFCVRFNITNLINKSLITISHYNKLEMHDLLQEMGRNIISEECISNPGRRSRLWDIMDIYDVLTKNKGTEAVQSIRLDISKSRGMSLKSDAFEGMTCLRFLEFYMPSYSLGRENKIHLPHHGLEYLSCELRYLRWDGFPSKYWPPNFCAENLVELNLHDSRVKRLWTGVQNLVNLKRINLTASKYLTEIPNLSKAKSIESIELGECESLVELPSFIQYLNKLTYLNAWGCENLKRLPSRINSEYLNVLNLGYCPLVKNCPEISGSVEELYLEGTANKELPKSIHSLNALRIIFLTGSNITKFPELSGYVEELHLTGTAIEELPPSIEFLTQLVELDVSNNKKLLRLPGSICKLKSLKSVNLSWTAVEEVPSSIGFLTNLVDLDLSNNKSLLRVPSSICKMLQIYMMLTLFKTDPSSKSSVFISTNCFVRLLSIRELPSSLEVLRVYDCESLEIFPSRYTAVSLRKLDLRNCINLNQMARSKIASLLVHGVQFLQSEIVLPGSEIPDWFSHQ